MPSFEQGRESLDVPVTPKSTNKLSDEIDPTTPQQPPGDVSVPGTAHGPPAPPHFVPQQDGPSEEVRARLDKVLQSDIGINILLTRLKQSISSVKDFSVFLKERASLEEKHAHGMKKLARGTNELVRRPENRQGSFASGYEEMTRIQDRMADNGMEFAQEVHLMADQLRELAADTEQGRKHWKHVGLDAESHAQEAEAAMDKAKARYFQLAEQYDRARTGEKQTGKFGLKGPKSAQQQEEALLGKVENADADYSGRVQAAQAQRHELLTSSRPQAVKEMQALISQCDAGLSAHMAKFAAFSEKLLLHNGLSVSPLKALPSGAPSNARSLKDLVAGISNQRDFHDYVLSHSNNVGPPHPEIKYERHPALQPTTQQPMNPVINQAHSQAHSQAASFTSHPTQRTDTSQGSFSGPPPQPGQTMGIVQPQAPGQYPPTVGPPPSIPQPPPPGVGPTGHRLRSDSLNATMPPTNENDYRSFSGPPGTVQHRPNQPSYSGQQGPQGHQRFASGQHQPPETYGLPGPGRGQPPPGQHLPSENYGQPLAGRGQPPQGQYQEWQPQDSYRAPVMPPSNYPTHTQKPSYGQPNDFKPDPRAPPANQNYPYPDGRSIPGQNGAYRPPTGQNGSPASFNPGGPPPPNGNKTNAALPPLRPVFGVSLDDLFRRDQSAVPTVVFQCVQAVDLYGLNTEGVYRTSGSAQHIQELRALFDHDSSQVEFRDPSSFHNDIAAVTTLLKQFLRELKDPLLTSVQYNEFIKAAKTDDDIARRDQLHALINSLPDPNYATLRTLVLHLNRVAQHSNTNRMTASNLAIVFGPTLMGAHGAGPSGEIKDAGWQARVVETIITNTLQIFDDDE